MIRVQAGHVGRPESGNRNTGSYNAAMEVSEQELTTGFTTELLAKAGRLGFVPDLEVIPADGRFGSCDMFVAIHCDGSTNTLAQGASVGYDNQAGSRHLASRWKQRYAEDARYPHDFRGDNYTRGLSRYYGYGNRYSKGATAKVVIELGFCTNNAELKWIQDHLGVAATALLDTFNDVTGSVYEPPGADSWADIASTVDQAIATQTRALARMRRAQSKIQKIRRRET